jgi:hypothetical protein
MQIASTLPEPSGLLLMGVGLILAAFLLRRLLWAVDKMSYAGPKSSGDTKEG